MLYLIKFFYNTFLLPSGCFVFALLIIGLWLYKRDKKTAAIILVVTFVLYICSTPLLSEFLLRSLENRYYPPTVLDGDALVMLGNGATLDSPDINGSGQLSGSAANRLITTARLYRITNLPIIVSGGKVFADTGNEAQIARRQLIELGVPGDKIIIENKSLNTAQNALFTKRLLEEKKFRKPILIVSAFQMHRAVLNFHNIDVGVMPYPTDYRTNLKQNFGAPKFIPSAFALSNTSLILKEYLGIVFLFL